MRSILLLLGVTSLTASATDWPEWRGAGRRGEWTETGIVEKFPASGLKASWRVPIRGGFTGPAVADGKVFVTDFLRGEGQGGTERAVCLDEKSGKLLWTREWPADYAGLARQYAFGPRATPTVDGDRVYVYGAKGHLACLDVKSGAVKWERDFVKEYGTHVPIWGMAGSPLVDGPRLICLAGGQPDAKVVALDKLTGKEIWRALSSEDSEPGYGQPIIFNAGGTRQLIMWHPRAVSSLVPETGKVLWEEPFQIRSGLSIATPVLRDNLLFVTAFYSGPMMLKLDAKRPAASILWRGKSNSEQLTDGLHCLIPTPVFDGKNLYGVCSYGQFRCLDAQTGERLWETQAVTKEKARWATAFLVHNGDRYFINNDRGELIIAKLSPKGYEEISRTHLIAPTSACGGRRELGKVNWVHPAYANRHLITRNDEEIIRVSLEQ
ncbi:MAG: PQQ-like beta-propeller repeat protein [Verrucomicrobia bacterium]|nr:PQQ-like beta-propeller repeat protein [Verrucomicrobiota bacterium]